MAKGSAVLSRGELYLSAQAARPLLQESLPATVV